MFLAEILTDLEWEILLALVGEIGLSKTHLWEYESVCQFSPEEYVGALKNLKELGFINSTPAFTRKEEFYRITRRGEEVVFHRENTIIS